MSGSVTISSSGVPARFRSMPLWPPPPSAEVFVQRLARVFFEVGAHQAHGFLLVAQEELDLAALHHRDLKLADLVALGQVGVEIVFAGKNAHGRNVGAEGQSEFDSALDGPGSSPAGAGQRQVHRAGLGVGLGAKGGGGAAEDLAGVAAGRGFRSR
jgi:hypothetical protein